MGCSTQPSRFYLLEPIPDQMNNDAIARSKMLVALAPVRIPQYADRPQIVTATESNVYQLSELDRWAEALDDNITRVLTENLSVLVPAEVLSTRTSNFSKQADFRLSVQILEFYIDPKGQARLTAQWLILHDGNKLLSQQMTYRSPASTDDYRRMVSALNECLNRMSRDMAMALRKSAAELTANKI
ncbi:MAG: PqiC family protein [Gammaproteobacteria bacterium]